MSDQEKATNVVADATSAVPAYEGPEFVIVIREGKDDQGETTIEMAALGRPEPLDLGNPVHAIGAFIATNFRGISQAAAMMARQAAEGPGAEQVEETKVIGPDRERTILLPGTPV